MDYKDIIEKGHLIYASRPSDKSFREWRIDKTICLVSYFKTYELTKLDLVLLLTLDSNDNKLYENQLARILGFNVENDFNSTPKRYADKGEEGIFQRMLQEVEAYGLIIRNGKEVLLSHLGRLSLETGKKYTLHRGNVFLKLKRSHQMVEPRKLLVCNLCELSFEGRYFSFLL